MDQEGMPQRWSGAAGRLAVLAPSFFAEGSTGVGGAAPTDTAWQLDDFAWDPVAMVRPSRAPPHAIRLA